MYKPFRDQVGETGPIKLNGIVYPVKKSRGKRNREFILQDFDPDKTTSLANLQSVPLRYEHGEPMYKVSFLEKPVGVPTKIMMTNVNEIYGEFDVFHNQPDLLTYEEEEQIRKELREGILTGLSFKFKSNILGYHNGKPIFDPETKQFLEISLCRKPFYKESKIASFSASAQSSAPVDSSKLEVLT
jgi:hypothetical protein